MSSSRPTLARLAGLSLALTAALSCTAGSDGRDVMDQGDDSPGGKADDLDGVEDAEFGLDARPSNFSCIAPAAPPSSSAIATVRAFNSLSFDQPTAMLQAPEDDSQWYVVEKAGRVRVFDNVSSPSSSRTFVDIRSVVESTPNEAGLLSIAFHPNWQSNGRVYLSFNLRQNGQLFSVLSTMRSTDGGQSLDTGTHEIVFSTTQPFSNHNGGQLAFGPDGLLYYGLGDGGSADDPNGNGQNTNTVLGTILRFDVDNPSGGNAYGIPSDNPFANGAGGRPEIYAWGLRNPWRFSFDRQTGDLFVGDVGQDEFEEVDIVVRGGNYGWDAKEAFACFEGPCNDPDLIDPIHAYDHTQGDRSITGGFVYRGSDIPGLQGTYIFGDIITGRIWGLSQDGGEWESELLLESGINMATFAEGHDGEIYVPNYFDGSIHRIVSAGPAPSSNFPDRLSETGCFDPSDPTEPGPGLVSYDVASPLWSDGADKERFMAIPPGTEIEMLQDGDFVFPVGTVLVKTFMLGGKRVETRLLMRHPDGEWGGYTYEWNDAQTDAFLLETSKEVFVSGQSWRIPSRADCDSCHTDAANIALGPEFIQLNSDHVYASTKRRANQMETLAHIGMIAGLDDQDFDADQIVRLFGLDDPQASVEDKARSYLHSNCSNCHRPGGPGRSDADMRFLVPFSGQQMCGTFPEAGSFGLFDARLVRPGDADNSVLLHRMEALDSARMPAIGSSIVDSKGAGVIRQWIDGMSGCP